jgi:amidophosphoribosyltransferase
MIEGLETQYKDKQAKNVIELGSNCTTEQIKEIFSVRPRVEKIAIKDAKLRTFITDDSNRDSLVGHVYDITYGQVQKKDNLVMIDDSIVRGTTLKKSILRILDRLNPKKIVIVSSAPQIRYPDCYGIDMARMGDFIAFKAAIALLKERGLESIIEDVYQKCKAQALLPKEEGINCVKEIYNPFTAEEISGKIVELLKPEDISTKVEIIFQSISGLHEACPNHKGDWYFTGDYPTLGGNKVVNKAFVYYIEGNNKRAY